MGCNGIQNLRGNLTVIVIPDSQPNSETAGGLIPQSVIVNPKIYNKKY